METYICKTSVWENQNQVKVYTILSIIIIKTFWVMTKHPLTDLQPSGHHCRELGGLLHSKEPWQLPQLPVVVGWLWDAVTDMGHSVVACGLPSGTYRWCHCTLQHLLVCTHQLSPADHEYSKQHTLKVAQFSVCITCWIHWLRESPVGKGPPRPVTAVEPYVVWP